MNNDVTFGEWLRRRRRGLDLTQQELAQRVGCAVSTLRKIEAGERRPSKDLVTQLAVCLDIAPEEYDNFITFARTEPYPDRPSPPPPATRHPNFSSAPIVTTPLPPFLAQDTSPVEPPLVFVARERELECLNQFLEQALDGRGQITFVVGGAGRGKTALLTEFARPVQGKYPDLLVAMGNCNAYSGIGDPYLPFRDVMGMLTGDVETKLAAGAITLEHARRLWIALLPTCQALLEYGRNLIDVLVPQQELLARAKLAAPRGQHELEQLRRLAERTETTKGDLAQEYLFQQLTNVLRALAERCPLLILLDDLQWADTTSLSLMFHLGRRLEGSRILVIGAYRPEEVALGRKGERHPLEKLLTEFKRMFGDVWVDLGQTAETENQQFVKMIVDTEPNRLGVAFRRALYQHTDGHPLFTIELLRAMQERGDLVRNEQGQWVEGASLNWERLPARVEAVIEERIGRLEEELRQILTVASVDGEEFTAQVVARVQAIGERQLLGQLSQTLARKHRLVRDRGEIRIGNQTLSRYQFAHILFQRYLYNELSAGERRLLHGEIGTVLETLYGDHAGEIAVQLAHHFQEANLSEKARRYLRQAGEQAAQQYANDEAISYFSHALELTPADDLTERYSLLLARVKVYDVRGEREAQQQDVEALSRLAETLDVDERRAEAALQRAIYAGQISDNPRCIAAAERAVALGRAAGAPAVAAKAYFYWAWALLNGGDYDAARRQTELSLNLTRELGDQWGEAQAILILGTAALKQGDYTTARAYYEQSLRLCHELNDQPHESEVFNNFGVIAAYQGDYAAARVYYEQSLRLVRKIGDRLRESMTLINLGDVAIKQGDYVVAHTYLEHGLRIVREIGNRWNEGVVLDNLGNIAANQRDYTTAQTYYEQSLILSRAIGDREGEAFALWGLGNVGLGLGDLSEAVNCYHQTLTLWRELGHPALTMEAVAGLARVALAQGDLAHAQIHVEEILSYLDQGRSLDGAEEPFWVYLTCYQVLQATHDPRAESILTTAYNLLQERAAKIGDEAARHMFWENVPYHRELAAAWAERHSSD